MHNKNKDKKKKIEKVHIDERNFMKTESYCENK